MQDCPVIITTVLRSLRPIDMKRRIGWYLTKWYFWLIVSLSVLAFVGTELGLEFLMIPYTMMFLGFIPAMAALALSVKFASILLRFHKYFLNSGRWPWNKKKQFRYTLVREFQKTPGIRRLAIITMLNVFGMTYNIYLVIEFFQPTVAEPNVRFGLIIGISLMSLIFAAILNVSALLLKVLGIMVEEITEGYRSNLGKELDSRLGGIVGITAVFSFGYVFYESADPSGIGLSLAIITLFVPSLLVSYYFVERKHIGRMKRQLREAYRKAY